MDFDSLDLRNQILSETIMRYLTSKGLRKDYDGMSALTKQDIQNIESGISNYKLANKFSLHGRVYQIVWELDMYLKGLDPTGHSVSQRIEFLKCAFSVFENNVFFGVGTGDIRAEMKDGYKRIHSQLENLDFLPHNQYMTMMIRYGFVGLCTIILSLALAVLLERKHRDFLVVVLFIVFFCSMINEDTLETQYGVFFFAFWGALLIFARGNETGTREPGQISFTHDNTRYDLPGKTESDTLSARTTK
jgi:hypothetical protein